MRSSGCELMRLSPCWVIKLSALNVMSPAGAEPCVSAVMCVPFERAAVSAVIDIAGKPVAFMPSR